MSSPPHPRRSKKKRRDSSSGPIPERNPNAEVLAAPRHPTRHTIVRVLAAVLAFSITSWVVAQIAFFLIFSFFVGYDDEGYLLISLKLFRQGHALYDAVYSQYGPFYYVFMEALLSLLRQNVTHDTGRLIATGFWTVTSLLCGVCLFRLTRNLAVGCAVQLLTALSLDSLRNEPMHPGGLICLVLGCIAVTTLLLPERSRLTWIILGALGASLLLTKINIGIFALLAIGLVALGASATNRGGRVLLTIVGALVVGAPALLMLPNLDKPWVAGFAIHVAAALLPLVVLEVVRPSATFLRNGLGWMLVGVFGMILLVSAIALLQGTSLHALVHAVLIAPLRQPGVLLVPLELPPQSRKVALVAALAGVAAVLWKRKGDRLCGSDELEGFVRSAAGVALWVTAASIFPGRLAFFLVPLAWIAALPVPGITDPPALAFARRLLPPLAVLQTLHAYPVAVSQIQWGTFLLIPVAAICVIDGGRQLGRSIVVPEKRPMVATVCSILIVLLAARPALATRTWSKAGYLGSAPLDLPGSRYTRVAPAQVAELQGVVRLMRDRGCSTYFSGPGLASFYFWIRRDPPTGFQATHWHTLFDEATQRAVIRDLEATDRLCVLQHGNLISVWAQNTPGPLSAYLLANYVVVDRLGPYDLMVRRPSGAT